MKHNPGCAQNVIQLNEKRVETPLIRAQASTSPNDMGLDLLSSCVRSCIKNIAFIFDRTLNLKTKSISREIHILSTQDH